MANASLPILPFPADIDRHSFASYVSGFTDGEGCFNLTIQIPKTSNRPTPSATFAIHLRADDLPVLRLIHSFFGCGYLNFVSRQDQRRRGLGTKDAYKWIVSNSPDLATIIVPHFDRYPLYAKKRADFAIWREGVNLLYHCKQQPRILSGRQGGLKWTEDRVSHFRSLLLALRNGRGFKMPSEAPKATLFD